MPTFNLPDGARLHYEDKGKRPTILFIHCPFYEEAEQFNEEIERFVSALA